MAKLLADRFGRLQSIGVVLAEALSGCDGPQGVYNGQIELIGQFNRLADIFPER